MDVLGLSLLGLLTFCFFHCAHEEPGLGFSLACKSSVLEWPNGMDREPSHFWVLWEGFSYCFYALDWLVTFVSKVI
jgi:hypothetical protein